MKRKSNSKYEHGIYWTWALFAWHKCIRCSSEFRREFGWRFLTGPYYNGSGNYRYICGTCCESKDHAHELAINYPDNSLRPSPPKGRMLSS